MHEKIYAIIFVMVIATQISRLGPLALSSKFHISENFEAWLKYVPVGVLTALIIPEFAHRTEGKIEMNWLYVISGIIALAIGLRFKNLMLTTFVGVSCLVILRIMQ